MLQALLMLAQCAQQDVVSVNEDMSGTTWQWAAETVTHEMGHNFKRSTMVQLRLRIVHRPGTLWRAVAVVPARIGAFRQLESGCRWSFDLVCVFNHVYDCDSTESRRASNKLPHQYTDCSDSDLWG